MKSNIESDKPIREQSLYSVCRAHRRCLFSTMQWTVNTPYRTLSLHGYYYSVLVVLWREIIQELSLIYNNSVTVGDAASRSKKVQSAQRSGLFLNTRAAVVGYMKTWILLVPGDRKSGMHSSPCCGMRNTANVVRNHARFWLARLISVQFYKTGQTVKYWWKRQYPYLIAESTFKCVIRIWKKRGKKSILILALNKISVHPCAWTNYPILSLCISYKPMAYLMIWV